MAVSRESSPKEEQGLAGRHVASLTPSEMVVLNLEQLQAMGAFSFELALAEESESRMLAYEIGDRPDCYLLLVPLPFYLSTHHRSKHFVQLLCLCSQSVTVPAHGPYFDELTALLRGLGVKWREKSGSSVVKLYLEGECWASYLDFVTCQAVQFQGKNAKELIAMKRANAYQYCLGAFREHRLPEIFQGREESVEGALEKTMVELQDTYYRLACEVRLGMIYEVMGEHDWGEGQLEREMQSMVFARHITTVGDEECEELINGELAQIVGEEFSVHEAQLLRMKTPEQQVFLVKILSGCLQKLRALNFEVNDEKYLFLGLKVIEQTYQLRDRQDRAAEEEKKKLAKTVHDQQTEIENLKAEVQKLKAGAKKERTLTVIGEEPQEKSDRKRVHSENAPTPKQTAHMTLKDVKQPLQLITPNGGSNLQKVGVARARQKVREGVRRQEEKGAKSGRRG